MLLSKPKKLTVILFLVVLCLGAGALPARSADNLQTLPAFSGGGPRLVIVADDRPVEPRAQAAGPSLYALQEAQKTATIQVNYLLPDVSNPQPWPPEAIQAFEYAKGIWETVVKSPVTIHVNAYWSPMGSNVLGGAYAEYTTAGLPGNASIISWYPDALANKLYGKDVFPSTPEITAEFNSNFPNWHFDPQSVPPFGKYDFASVVLHELGHGLGFSGSMFVGSAECGGSGKGCWGYGTKYPFIYDRFTENGSGKKLISDFPNKSAELAAQLQSNNLYFSGPNATHGNGDSRVKLYAPSTWRPGSSYSHLDESFNGTGDALMTYSLSPREIQRLPGAIVLGILKDIGWEVGAAPAPTFVPKVFVRIPLVINR